MKRTLIGEIESIKDSDPIAYRIGTAAARLALATTMNTVEAGVFSDQTLAEMESELASAKEAGMKRLRREIEG